MMTSVGVVHFDDEKNEACHDLFISLYFSGTT
jgi:hypothetical protein